MDGIFNVLDECVETNPLFFRGHALFCLLLGLFGLDGAALFLGGFSHNLDLSCAVLFHFKLISRCAGKVDNAIVGIRSTIINRDLDLLFILEIGHLGFSSHR